MRSSWLLAGLLLGLVGGASAQSHRDQSAWTGAKGWWAVMDTPAADSLLYSVDMPPGWHITAKGPGAVLGDSAWVLGGPGAIETDIVLFPGTSMEGYGIFLAGAGLDTPYPAWTGVLLRRDGKVAIVRHGGGKTESLSDWIAHDAIKPGDQSGTVRNTMRLEIGHGSLEVFVNGASVARMGGIVLDFFGPLGLRVGAGLNLHVTRMEVSPKASHEMGG